MDEIQLTEEKYQITEILVDPGQSPIRIDKFIMDRIENISRTKIQEGLSEGLVLVNGKNVKANYKVRPKDVIVMHRPKYLDEEFVLLAEPVPFDVVYEDDVLMVVNKPSGIVVHPGVGNWSGTLVNGIKYYLENKNLPIKEGNNQDRAGLVHRIDKYTSGLLVIAKTDEAMTHLSKQFSDHTIGRKYTALVWGSPEPSEGKIDNFIGRNPNNRLEMKVFPEAEKGKRAVTHYKVVRDFYYVSLIECQLETGRTHQIRVHLKHLNSPIFNDERYGGNSIRKGTVYSKYKQFVNNCFKLQEGQALHAHYIEFTHPETGKRMEFTQELPEGFRDLVNKWEHYLDTRRSL